MERPEAPGPDDRLPRELAVSRRAGAARLYPDALYGEIRLPGWAVALLETPPFQRLRGVSLSDVPGELLFRRPFPSRLDHALGVFHLARLARPRDRVLQVAALAHDLGHGPFSHLSEPLMRERTGEDHEQRSARLILALPALLTPAQARKLAWLRWEEAAALVLARGADGRGELLNGRLDYDNADNVARFLLASGLGVPQYDPAALARGLRLLPSTAPPKFDLLAPETRHGRVALDRAAAGQARAWQADRATVYTYLHEGHENLALHVMLRRAIDLATQAEALPPHFLDLTDEMALRMLRRLPTPGVAPLVAAVCQGRRYTCVWEAELPRVAGETARHMSTWRERVAVESGLAAEAALRPHEVAVEVIASSAARALPPVAHPTSAGGLAWPPDPPRAPQRLHVFAPPDIGHDYARRLCFAAERRFGSLGIVLHSAAG